MKVLLLILALLISSMLLAQQDDTVFLKREVADRPYPFYHAVFIDTGIKFKTELTSFNFNHFDSATYFDQLTNLRPLKNSKTSIKNNFPRKWIALYKLKGKYYLYRPSDLGNLFRFELTDSTTIDFSMEGPEPSRINKVSFPSPTQAIITRTNYWEGKQVSIKIVDQAKGIAVFTFSPTKYNKHGYKILMVDGAKAHLFPIVVNYCQTDKQPEFEFDKIDFKSLTK